MNRGQSRRGFWGMSSSTGGASASRAAALAAVALACGVGSAVAGSPGPNARALPGLAPGGKVAAETVYFADPRRAPVRLLRGLKNAAPAAVPAAAPPGHTEIVSFGAGSANRVTVIRGGAGTPVSPERPIDPAAQVRVEQVSFADPRQPAVTVVRGPESRDLYSVDLFDPPNASVLDRIAFAVDGVESRHGTDLRMWRPEPDGPQGPMQVSAAAAFDVGGGDRFDMRQNRLLGRAYLAQMFQRYGNWADAVAAYNWGPGSMDQWIAGGRRADQLPPGVAWYVDLVLRNALMTKAAASR